MPRKTDDEICGDWSGPDDPEFWRLVDAAVARYIKVLPAAIKRRITRDAKAHQARFVLVPRRRATPSYWAKHWAWRVGHELFSQVSDHI